jgi:DNA-binding NtrC family response regulator
MSSENTYILAVDDEIEMLQNYTRILSGAGYNVLTAKSGAEALRILKDESTVILAICDLNMPGMDGLSLLSEMKRHYPYLPVIMVTGYGTLEQGIKAVKAGVYDFIEKPFSKDKLLKTIAKALKDIQPPEISGETASGFDDMIGKSPAIMEIFDLIKRVSFGNANVMVTGESGVGKELVVRSIHKNSMRRNHPLIPVNCGALPASLFESELFGYDKGAFTGAFQSKPGLVELANGGTLFLDKSAKCPWNCR